MSRAKVQALIVEIQHYTNALLLGDKPEAIEHVRGVVRQRAFPILAQKTVIDFALLGSDAGYIGAAGIARLAHHRTSKTP